MMYWNEDMGGLGYVLMLLSFVLFWGVIITTVILFGRSTGASNRRYEGEAPGRSMAEDLLAERFARGEIDEDEYTARLSTLRRGSGAPR
ncbi:SHOCT domain-containing protein [Paeniglutamicibacter psychrophenolicus]|uniref:SHOCT domain-containing protein n=1 Tax=Paeniglutamicibacter psychrophenolicus TaxID=257454 RepID=UPI00278894FB|nr:SHOCT domain-containing protein [Paeniglutamicibacter psychrophenolicus]MDQ0092499.1 putative membrane protein [Paeniglutamicibacter psychrophenolicus]